ncbi:hypothetical protein [Phenylobacterium sp.]|uniref:hypothetical protein n=1 Tax=Phenylobacterium sp. TaxID=1871053 RepID=UPI002DF12312|nr:hypothetical protein [Phenylobacterium sp.]
MKKQLLGMMAAGLLLTAGAAQAAVDPQVQAFVDHVQAQVQAKVNDCGVDLARSPVKITGYIEPDGRLKSIHVESADGGRASEASIVAAVRKVRVDDVPAGLIDAKLTIYLGHGG